LIGEQIDRPSSALKFSKWSAAHFGQATHRFLGCEHRADGVYAIAAAVIIVLLIVQRRMR
jgi:hypothetical protein